MMTFVEIIVLLVSAEEPEVRNESNQRLHGYDERRVPEVRNGGPETATSAMLVEAVVRNVVVLGDAAASSLLSHTHHNNPVDIQCNVGNSNSSS